MFGFFTGWVDLLCGSCNVFWGRLWSLNWSACIFDFLPFHVTLKYHICYWQPIALNLLNKIYDYCLGSSLPSFLPLFLCQFPTLIYLVIGNIFSLAVIVNYFFFFFFFCNLCSHRNYSGICLFLVWKILSIFYRPTFVTSQECRENKYFPIGGDFLQFPAICHPAWGVRSRVLGSQLQNP